MRSRWFSRLVAAMVLIFMAAPWVGAHASPLPLALDRHGLPTLPSLDAANTLEFAVRLPTLKDYVDFPPTADASSQAAPSRKPENPSPLSSMTSALPEPGVAALMALGFAGIGWLTHRRTRKAAREPKASIGEGVTEHDERL